MIIGFMLRRHANLQRNIVKSFWSCINVRSWQNVNYPFQAYRASQTRNSSSSNGSKTIRETNKKQGIKQGEEVNKEAKEKYKILKTLIEVYRKAYDKGESLISDEEYDKIYEEYSELEQNHPDLLQQNPDSPTQVVGNLIGEGEEGKGKKRHNLPMLGLQNAYDDAQLLKFQSKMYKDLQMIEPSEKEKGKRASLEFVMEMKYDGMAVSLLFLNGKFQYALSRGDGVFGEDLTDNFLFHVKNLPFPLNSRQLPIQVEEGEVVEIRGEVVASTEEFHRVNQLRKGREGVKTFSTSRNLVTGTLNKQFQSSLTIENDINLHLICYSIYIYSKANKEGGGEEGNVRWSSKQPQTQVEGLKLLESMKFEVCPRAILSNKNIKEDCFPLIHEYQIPANQQQFPFITDGVVIKLNSLENQLKLGRIARSYRWAIAYKFPTDSFITKLNDIQFQIGRTGKATPVAHLDLIVIDGSNVSRATMHNIHFIEQHNIKIGDFVKVEKSGGTIPKIIGLANHNEESTRKDIELVCPCFKRVPLHKIADSVDLFCTHEACTLQRSRLFLHFSKALEINGLGESVIDQLLDANLLENIYDIFILSQKREELSKLPRWGTKKVDNLLQSIEAAKSSATLAQMLFGLAIPNAGVTICSQLASKFGSIEKLKNASIYDLTSRGFSQSCAEAVVHFFETTENKNTVNKLQEYVPNFH